MSNDQFAPAWLPRSQRRHVNRALGKLFRHNACSICGRAFEPNSPTAPGLDAQGTVVLAGECCAGKVAQIFGMGLYQRGLNGGSHTSEGPSLGADRAQLETFVLALFKHATAGNWVSLRAFPDQGGNSKPFRTTAVKLNGNLNVLIDKAYRDAELAARNPQKIVFCPPTATFTNAKHAREKDLAEGLVLSTECDADAERARIKLEQLLGPATLVVASGGQWVNPKTNKPELKLHVHHRLKIPAASKGEQAKLKLARELATRLVGGDPSNVSIVHPIRWPGSVHRKGDPKLCRIISVTDNEIDLDTALQVLQDAAGNGEDPAAARIKSERLLFNGQTVAPAFAHLKVKSLGAGIDSSFWYDRLTPEQKDQVVDHALEAIANKTTYLELEDVGKHIGDNYQWYRLTTAVARSGAPHAEDIFVKYASKAMNADPEDALRNKFTICQKKPSAKYREITVGTLLHLAQEHGADFERWRDLEREPQPNVSPVGLNFINAGTDDWNVGPRGWLLANVFCREFVSSLLGDGAVGKTALRYAQYLSLATGKNLTNEHVFVRSRVLLISLEDGLKELRRRIKAACLHHGIEQRELDGWLYYVALGAKDGKLMILDRHGRPIPGSLGGNLEHNIVELRPDLLALDPFVKTHGVDENNNSAIDDVVQILTDMTNKHYIAIDIPHHVSKGPADPGNADRGRGASAMKDAARLVCTLTPMTTDEAKALGVEEAERRFLRRMDGGKVNIAPPAIDATWFRLVGVPLGNGNEIYPNGDIVQTVEPWTPPDIWRDMSALIIHKILNTIEAGLPNGDRYSDSARAEGRAAWPLIVDHCPDKTEGQAKQIITKWLKSGLLVRRDYTNKKRQNAKGLYVDNGKRPAGP